MKKHFLFWIIFMSIIAGIQSKTPPVDCKNEIGLDLANPGTEIEKRVDFKLTSLNISGNSGKVTNFKYKIKSNESPGSEISVSKDILLKLCELASVEEIAMTWKLDGKATKVMGRVSFEFKL